MTPKAPDPYATAQAQTGSNLDAAVVGSMANNINQKTPFGSISYNQSGVKTFKGSDGKTYTVPNVTSETRFSPEQQQLYNKQVAAGKNLGDVAVSQSARLGKVLNTPFSLNGLPEGGKSIGGSQDWSADRRRVEDAVMSRFDEGFARDESAKQTQLINQGLAPGSEAWNTQMDELNRAKTDARSQAVLAGGQEQSRMAGLDLQGEQWDEGLRANRLNESFAMRNQPLNEIAALLSGAQVSAPQFSAPYQQAVAPADISGLIGQNYQGKVSQNNAMMSGLFGLGSAGLTGMFGLSDRRAKTNIRKIAKTSDGQNLYSYRYKGDPETRVGLMADEVLKRNPAAVARRPDGLLAVDYAEALKEAA